MPYSMNKNDSKLLNKERQIESDSVNASHRHTPTLPLIRPRTFCSSDVYSSFLLLRSPAEALCFLIHTGAMLFTQLLVDGRAASWLDYLFILFVEEEEADEEEQEEEVPCLASSVHRFMITLWWWSELTREPVSTDGLISCLCRKCSVSGYDTVILWNHSDNFGKIEWK